MPLDAAPPPLPAADPGAAPPTPPDAGPDPAAAPAAALASHREVASRVTAELERHRLTQAQVARESGLGPSVLNGFLRGRYAGDNDAVAATLAAWLNSRAARAEAVSVLPQAVAWVPTPTAAKILSALEYAHHFGDLAVVYGGAGTGKTATIRRYAATHSGVHHVTATPATAAVATLLEEIALAIGLKDFPVHPARLCREIARRLTGAAALLVVDEAQHLGQPALEVLRSLHDAAGCGLVLAGNARVYERLHGGARREDFAQLFSRCGRKVALRAAVHGDCDAIARAWGVHDADCLAYLRARVALPGALRGIVKTLRLAMTIAAGAGEPVGLAHLQRAWRELDADGAAPADPRSGDLR